MNFDPKAIRRALMVAKSLATSIDPGFAKINVPMPPEGVPLERAEGGSVKYDRNTGRLNVAANEAIHLEGLGKFFDKDDPLAKYVPERATHMYALHPEKWTSTFYSLTNKDPQKIGYYKPKKIETARGKVSIFLYFY